MPVDVAVLGLCRDMTQKPHLNGGMSGGIVVPVGSSQVEWWGDHRDPVRRETWPGEFQVGHSGERPMAEGCTLQVATMQ